MRYLNLKLSILLPLLLNLSVKFLDLELDGVELNQQLRVFLGPLLYVILCTCLILNRVNLKRGYRSLHVPQLPV